MCSLFAGYYWKAACKEVEPLENMVAWEIIDHTPDMNVLELTWSFNIKRFLSGLINKFKSVFFDRGNQKLEGVNYFKTYAPVVQCTTFRLMVVLEVVLDLK